MIIAERAPTRSASRLRYDSVTDLSQPAAPQPGDPQPADGASEPQRSDDLPPQAAGRWASRCRSAAGSLRARRVSIVWRRSAAMVAVRATPQACSVGRARRGDWSAPTAERTLMTGDTLPRLRDALVAFGEPQGQRDATQARRCGSNCQRRPAAKRRHAASSGGGTLSPARRLLPQRGALPQRGDSSPSAATLSPSAATHSPSAATLPQRGDSPPARRLLPQRGRRLSPPARPPPARRLPPPARRLSPAARRPAAAGGQRRPRRPAEAHHQDAASGRHRSPHRLSVASDAPALVLAVPGSAEADTAEIGPRVASIAEPVLPRRRHPGRLRRGQRPVAGSTASSSGTTMPPATTSSRA